MGCQQNHRTPTGRGPDRLDVLHPPLSSVAVSTWMRRGSQQNVRTLAGGYTGRLDGLDGGGFVRGQD